MPKSTRASRKDEVRSSSLSHDENPVYGKGSLLPQESPESKYGPTKIKVIQVWEPSEEIAHHPIQVLFEQYNEFVKIIFTQRAVYETTYKEKLPRLLRLAKKLGLTLMKGQLQPSNLKSRENSNLLKEKLVACWCRIISETNCFDSEIPSIFNKKLNENTKSAVEIEQNAMLALQALTADKQQLV